METKNACKMKTLSMVLKATSFPNIYVGCTVNNSELSMEPCGAQFKSIDRHKSKQIFDSENKYIF